MGEQLVCAVPLFRVLQFLSDSQRDSRHPGDGSRHPGSCVGAFGSTGVIGIGAFPACQTSPLERHMASATTLLGAAGEYHVMTELLRRGYIAALAPHAVPSADIIASDLEG